MIVSKNVVDSNGITGAVPGVPGRDYPVHQEHTHHHLRNVVDRFPCPRASSNHVYLADRASRCQVNIFIFSCRKIEAIVYTVNIANSQVLSDILRVFRNEHGCANGVSERHTLQRTVAGLRLVVQRVMLKVPAGGIPSTDRPPSAIGSHLFARRLNAIRTKTH